MCSSVFFWESFDDPFVGLSAHEDKSCILRVAGLDGEVERADILPVVRQLEMLVSGLVTIKKTIDFTPSFSMS